MKRDLIVKLLLEPQSLFQLSMPDWDLLVRQGRRANLLAKLADKLTQLDLIDNVPDSPRHHLNSALKVAQRQNIAMRWEVECLRLALNAEQINLILLKGAAYVLAGLDVARGRTFSDVDILVPKKYIELAEGALMMCGWHGSHHDEYEQRYYRQWMHEIPPMQHIQRGTTVDVHHTLLPETGRVKVNASALFDGMIATKGNADIFVLRKTDMFLHSAAHLFHEGDFEKGLRDLFDLDSLLREFSKDENFWMELVPRAKVVGLMRPLYYALRYSALILQSPVPQHVIDDTYSSRPFAIGLMDACYVRALRPQHSSCESFLSKMARFFLYVRSHWIKMPIHLLSYHLARKLFLRSNPEDFMANQESVEDKKLK